MISRFIPSVVKLQIKLLLLFFKDSVAGNHSKFAKKSKEVIQLKYEVVLSQHVKQTASFSAKVNNITIGFNEIQKVVIQPGELFSFWDVVGNPSKNNGYKKGRNLVSGKVKESYGGGLCQLSGIIYHLSLLTGLTIVERYNHTVDIYTEETRFTPLGSDATVVYGYKDLRIRNDFNFPIAFTFDLIDETLTAKLKSSVELETSTIDFKVQDKGDKLEVKTFNGFDKPIAFSFYKKMEV